MMADPNIGLLIQIAEALGDLRERLVFVGGCATALLITDPAAAPVRATEDVDTIVAIVSKREYHQFCEALHAVKLLSAVPPLRLLSGRGHGCVQNRIEQMAVVSLGGAELCVQLIAKRHQFLHFSNDAILFGDRWEWNLDVLQVRRADAPVTNSGSAIVTSLSPMMMAPV